MLELRRLVIAAAVLSCLSGCAGPRAGEQRAAAAPATGALGKGDLGAAGRHAEAALSRDRKNSQAALVRAITRYERAMKQASKDLRTVVIGGAMAGGLNQRYLTSALAELDAALRTVEGDLALASQDPEISLELCLACWEKDWNGNGRVDSRDRLLFQIEQDASGRPIPDGDPRRKPTFRFDLGDVYWARAFVAFQRAAIDVLSAYDFSELDRLLDERGTRPQRLRLRLVHPERMRSAREHVLRGLAHSEQSRRAYLRERDDDREWVPSPRQKSHPLPLPVDGALYATWEGVVGDLERLVRGQEGLSVRELAQLGDHRWENPPGGFIDVGGSFSAPRDIVIDLDLLERAERKQDVEAALGSLLGANYRRQMKPSPLPSRLSRMKGEVDRGEESLERKLRYLFWIN
ncbi:MAG: hypothetical protein HS104_17470 [Polyangiaceae bacterium]|nr:hypothetical protein [Polyangiaceae bacterium]MCE7888272.1 hypothetical protein [Sorangiineae bacterium PRO1]MCL4752160.1 hypothetical protein [Myxococcales bacterium]